MYAVPILRPLHFSLTNPLLDARCASVDSAVDAVSLLPLYTRHDSVVVCYLVD